MGERDDRLRAEARECFAQHEIRESSEKRWLLQRRGRDGRWVQDHAAEVLVLIYGELYVGGDIDHVVFSRYGDSDEPRARVRWIGECGDVAYYVTQKAGIGSGKGRARVYDSNAARAELETVHAQLLVEDPEGSAAVLEILEAALESADFDDRYALVHRLYDADEFFRDWALDDLGMVVSPRVYKAHAALARLCALWREEKPPWS